MHEQAVTKDKLENPCGIFGGFCNVSAFCVFGVFKIMQDIVSIWLTQIMYLIFLCIIKSPLFGGLLLLHSPYRSVWGVQEGVCLPLFIQNNLKKNIVYEQYGAITNEGPRPSIDDLELPLSDICWKEKNIFFQFKSVVTVIKIDGAQGKF